MTDPVPAIEKRLARGYLPRHFEKIGTWQLSDGCGERTIRNPVSQSVWLAIWVATFFGFIALIMLSDVEHPTFEQVQPVLLGAIGTFAVGNTYFTFIPMILRMVYRVPRLSKEQRQAVEEYEKLQEDDRRQAKSALYEFVRMDSTLQHDKYWHKHHVWCSTLEALAQQHKLEHKLELQTPSDAEQALAALQARNQEIQHELN